MTAPLTISVTVDQEEYSRYLRGYDTVAATVTTTGPGVTGEDITIELIKARRNYDVAVATKTITLAGGSDPAMQQVSFDLRSVVDSEEIPLVRRGDYLIRATSVTDTGITGDSPEFKVSVITVEWLRDNYLHGTDQKSSEVLTPVEQPVNITGVTVFEVSRGHTQNWFTLQHTYSTDSQQHFLSWACGPLVEIVAGQSTYILQQSDSSHYIRVRVSSIAALPTATATDSLLIDRKPLGIEGIQDLVDNAISWVEEVVIQSYLEPTRVVTQVVADNITFDSGSDIPNFINADYDEIVKAVQFNKRPAGQWINFKMPYRPLIRFDELFGQIANTRIVDIALEWIESGVDFVQLVPFNQEIAFNFIGLVWVESIRGPVPLPNFWNFNALVGFRKLPHVLLEMIAKKAAIDVLTIAGQAFRGGFSSQSVSRDGISESVSYTASATYGIYSATIEDYRKWIDNEMPNIRGTYRGPHMLVL